MLISHAHRFIFIKTRKTAGTSIEIALSAHLDHPDDVITPISAQDEALRTHAPRNHLGPDGEPRFYNHMPAVHIQALVPEHVWERSLKISVERHPYEKVVSMAWYRLGRPGARGGFAETLDDVVRGSAYRNYGLYAIHGRVVADVMLRTEHLLEDTNALLERLMLPTLPSLPRAKAAFRGDRRPAAEVLSDVQKRTVQERCAEEFEVFGYPR